MARQAEGDQSRPVDRRTLLVGTGTAGAAVLAGCGPGQAAARAAGTVVPAGAAAAAAPVVRVTIEVNRQALVEQLHAYLSDPSPARNHRPIVDEFSSPRRLGLPLQLLEAMVLDGEPSREDVEALVDGLLSGYENLVVR